HRIRQDDWRAKIKLGWSREVARFVRHFPANSGWEILSSYDGRDGNLDQVTLWVQTVCGGRRSTLGERSAESGRARPARLILQAVCILERLDFVIDLDNRRLAVDSFEAHRCVGWLLPL